MSEPDEVERLMVAFEEVSEGADSDTVVWALVEALMAYCEDADDRSEIIDRINFCLGEIRKDQVRPEGVVLQ